MTPNLTTSAVVAWKGRFPNVLRLAVRARTYTDNQGRCLL